MNNGELYLKLTDILPWGTYASHPIQYCNYFEEALPEESSGDVLDQYLRYWNSKNPETIRYMADFFSDPTAIRVLAKNSGLHGGIAIGSDTSTKMNIFKNRPDTEQLDWDLEHHIYYVNEQVKEASQILRLHTSDENQKLFSIVTCRPEGGIKNLPSSLHFWMSILNFAIEKSTNDAIILLQSNVNYEASDQFVNCLDSIKLLHEKWHVEYSHQGNRLCIIKKPVKQKYLELT